MARGSDRKLTQAMRFRDRQDLVDDLADLRTKVNLLLTKLDADGGVTDEDYFDALAVAAQKTTN